MIIDLAVNRQFSKVSYLGTKTFIISENLVSILFLGDQPNGLWYAKHFCRFLEISVNYDLSYDKIQDDKYLQNKV